MTFTKLTIFIFLLSIFLTPSKAHALDPGETVICCLNYQETQTLSTECTNPPLSITPDQCPQILEQWKQTEREWLNQVQTPSSNTSRNSITPPNNISTSSTQPPYQTYAILALLPLIIFTVYYLYKNKK